MNRPNLTAADGYDRVLMATRAVYQAALQSDPDLYGSVDAKYAYLMYCDVFRGFMAAGDGLGFVDYAQRLLSKEPDRTMFYLESLYEALGLTADSTWEDFEAVLFAGHQLDRIAREACRQWRRAVLQAAPRTWYGVDFS
jgi:hypothetical protein